MGGKQHYMHLKLKHNLEKLISCLASRASTHNSNDEARLYMYEQLGDIQKQKGAHSFIG